MCEDQNDQSGLKLGSALQKTTFPKYENRFEDRKYIEQRSMNIVNRWSMKGAVIITYYDTDEL